MKLVESLKNSRDIEFVIFGNVYDPILTDYANLRKYGNYSRTLIGQILQKEKIDVNLLLSIVPETFSYTLTESVACGVPVIAHDIGALRERVAKYCAGFLVPHENSVPHVARILKDLHRHREVLTFFRRNCTESARAILSIEDMVDAHYTFYKSLKEEMVPAS
jgi:glycosyltransferase involved in cell wall biosynthesis